MEFKLTEEQVMMKKVFRELADKEIAPRAEHIDQTGEFPRENLRSLAREGHMGIPIPEEWGGAGADFLTYMFCLEEISRACATTGVILAVHTSLGIYSILYHGTEEQKKRFVMPLAQGEMLGAFALSEPGAGSDAAALKTRARKEGDHYILNGNKVWITSAGEADIYVVFATMDPEKRTRGITAFLVEKDTPGLLIGAKEKKMGLNGSATCELVFEDCRVPAENLLGEEGGGFKIAMSLLDGGRIGIAAQGLGIAQAAFDAAVQYAKTREQFGRPIADFQAIQFKLADLATELEAARLLVYQAAFRKGHDLSCTREASMAKVFATDLAMKAGIEAVQVYGGYGYSREYPVERYMRDAKVTQIYEGTNQIQRIVIARECLK